MSAVVYFGVLLIALVFLIGCAIYAFRVTAARGTRLSRGRWWKSTWLAAGVLLSLDFSIQAIVASGWKEFSIPTASSAPSVMIGDYIVADVRPGYHPARGDIVIFNRANLELSGRRETWIKRVIGLPGDRIGISKGIVSINGQPALRKGGTTYPLRLFVNDAQPDDNTSVIRYTETLPGGLTHQILSMTDDSDYENLPEVIVPEGHYYLLGDNRDDSEDSRMQAVGFVAAEAIVGKVCTIIWSRDRSRILTSLE